MKKYTAIVKKYTAIVFDLDGTLLNTLSDLTGGVNATMQAFSFPTHTEEEVRVFVGNGVKKLIERALPKENRDEKTIESAYAYFKKYYTAHCADFTLPYQGMVELIAKCRQKGIPMSVVSNKDEEMSKLLCKRFFGDVFAIVLGGVENRAKKPDPTAVFLAAEKMGVSPEEILYVGDSDVDFQTAKNAKTGSVLVSWGFRRREELKALSPDFLADDTNELFKILTETVKDE